jgi:hypothetical protein
VYRNRGPGSPAVDVPLVGLQAYRKVLVEMPMSHRWTKDCTDLHPGPGICHLQHYRALYKRHTKQAHMSAYD